MAKRDEFFFDTSALVKYYNNEPSGSKAVKFWINDFNQMRAEKLSFFLPNICIVETMQVLYYGRYAENKIVDDIFLTIKANLLNDIASGKYSICALDNKDIKKALEIHDEAKNIYLEIQEEIKNTRLEDTTKGFLSAMDIKILAIALNFKVKHPNFYLVTADIPMSRAAKRLGLNILDPNNYQTFPHDRFKPPLNH